MDPRGQVVPALCLISEALNISFGERSTALGYDRSCHDITGAKEKDAVWLARCRRPGVDRVCAVVDDVRGARHVDAMAPRRWSETDRQFTGSFCRTQQGSSTAEEEHQ